jgi:hypothetical protein
MSKILILSLFTSGFDVNADWCEQRLAKFPNLDLRRLLSYVGYVLPPFQAFEPPS